jgi:hypothetical protein
MDETAYERQMGPVVLRRDRVLRGVIEPEWAEAWEKFRKLRNNGIAASTAVRVFEPLKENPALYDAAQFVLECYERAPAKAREARKPSERFEAMLGDILSGLKRPE